MLVFQLTLALLFGFAGYRHALTLEGRYGQRAWGMAAPLWGLITGFSLLFGVILMYAAERGLKSRPAPPLPTSGQGQHQLFGWMDTAQAPAVPAAAVPVAAVPAAAVPPQVPAGWHPDPSGRHQHRWWDGATWTPHVSTNGVATID